MVAVALTGASTYSLKEATDAIIVQGQRPSDVLRLYGAEKLQIDHIDLIEVAPLKASLKIYGGRSHCKRMQDLPFKPDMVLTPEKIAIVRHYCINDLDVTELLYEKLKDDIELRIHLGQEYGVDLRSKSDAQIAEAVIREEIFRINGYMPKKPVIPIGSVYKFNVPYFIRYKTPLLQSVLEVIRNANFVVGEDGSIDLPKEIRDLKITIGSSTYQMGIGGLHSTEKTIAHIASPDVMLIDRDVVSYYPRIILNQELYPKHLGRNFLVIFGKLTARRIAAKVAQIIKTAGSLKIVINGTFGKTGSKWSIIYSPDLTIQTTVTGQLALLMLIEEIELAGIEVISGNTDGVVIKCPTYRYNELNAIIADWEFRTNFETEETKYKAIYSRDINNYIAVKEKGGVKTKGAYGDEDLKKNPTNQICSIAIERLLVDNVPIAETIRNCRDVTKFISVRAVKGGADKNGVYLGKAIRWYKAVGEEGEIVYAINGNKVPRTEGCKPLMELPDQLPTDIDYDWYIAETESILADIGYA